MPDPTAMEQALLRIRDGKCGYCGLTAIGKITPIDCPHVRTWKDGYPCYWEQADAEAEAHAALETST